MTASMHPVTRALPSLAALAILAACGTAPAADVDAVPDGGGSDASRDSGGHTDTATCSGSAGFECTPHCLAEEEVVPIHAAECTDGRWLCPEHAPQVLDDCGSPCPGEPLVCCAPNSGIAWADQVCVLGAWTCEAGGPEYCLPIECAQPRPACCFADARPTSAQCSAATGWTCPQETGPEHCGQTVEITGTWFEVARLGCDGADEPAGADPVAELVIADGFELTFQSGMFETFRNYWGRWEYDRTNGRIDLYWDGGNTSARRTDLSGSVIEVDGRTLFRDVWFGTSDDDPNPGICGYVMDRR